MIPAAGAPDVFEECLSSIFSGSRSPREVILVDDAMDQRAHDIASRFPIRVEKNPRRGVSAARNHGASLAKNRIILFMDTDVVLSSDALEIVSDAFNDPGTDGVVGVQSAALRFRGFFSRYKNHWMRYTYRRLTQSVHLFYTSCAAILRDRFLETQGFDENYRMPSIEDTVFGAELGKQNIRIKPLRSFEIEHVKGYSLKTVLKTDFLRSAALVRFVLRNWSGRSRGGIRNTSVPREFMLGAIAMCLALLMLVSMPFTGTIGGIAFLVCCAIVNVLNGSWLSYLLREEGFPYMIGACVFMPLDVTFVVAGMATGVIGFIKGNRY